MGRHHSDSEESHGRSKKKKKRRSRSRSDSLSSDSSRSNRSRKKSKKSHRRHSRSRSSSRSYRRNYRKSRSRSPGRYTRSRSRSYRSYSRSRSRSPRRHKHSSRTASPRRRSRSRSHRKSLSRSPRRRSRTPRRSRSRSRRCSVSPGYKTRSRSASKSRSKKGYSSSSDIKVEPGIPVPPSKQAELKLQQALRAAAIADEKLKEAGLLPEGVGRSLQDINLREQHDAGASRAAAIEAIEDEGFTQTHFTSSKNAKASSGSVLPTHDNAIFGSLSLDLPETDPAKILKAGPCDPKSLMHPNFFVPAEKKMEKWCQKLKTMRDRKLEGEEM